MPDPPTFVNASSATATSFTATSHPNQTVGSTTYRLVARNTVGGVSQVTYSDPFTITVMPRELRFSQDYPDTIYLFLPKPGSVPPQFNTLNQSVVGSFTNLQYQWLRDNVQVTGGSSAATIDTSTLSPGTYVYKRNVTDSTGLATPISTEFTVIVEESDIEFFNNFVPF
jgi:hypothetical protein